MQDVEEEELSAEEMKERKIMKLLLKVKNGTPPQRKSALRQLTDKARDFGAGPLFNQILPLLMSPTLEDQERHLLVKVPLLHYLLCPDRCEILPLLLLSRTRALAMLCCIHLCEIILLGMVLEDVCFESYWPVTALSPLFGAFVPEQCFLSVCRSLTGYCTSWTSWCGRSCTRSWSSSSRS